MYLEILYHNGASKSVAPSPYFEWKTELAGLLLDDNKERKIRSFSLTDNGKTLSSGVFTILGKMMMNN